MSDHRDDAAAWFAVLRRGLMTPEERAGYELWRAKTRNAQAMEELDRIWSQLGPIGGNSSADSRAGGRSPGLSRSARLAAMLSAASIMVSVLYRLNGSWWTTLDWWSR